VTAYYRRDDDHALAERAWAIEDRKGEEGGGTMPKQKRTIHLSEVNWADYFSDDYPASVVKALKLTEASIDPDRPIVSKLLDLLARKNEQSTLVRYEMSKP
jgi:hypothetical protein